MAALWKLRKLADPEIRAKNLLEAKRAVRRAAWTVLRPQDPDPVFIIGCSRSGTTVTYETIAESGRFLTFGYEIPQFWNALYGPLNNGWDSEAAGPENAEPDHGRRARRFFYERLGRGCVLEKTCINTMRVGYLHTLFPRSKFVFIHRDGRDNVSSMIDGWRYGRTDGDFGLDKFLGASPEPVSINGGEFQQWHFFLPPGWRAFNRSSLEEVCAFQWVTCNRLALDAAATLPPEQWIQVRYEDIFDRPSEMFRDVFERLGIPTDATAAARFASLADHPTSIVKGLPQRQKWKTRNPEAIERISDMIRPMMERLGYSMDC